MGEAMQAGLINLLSASAAPSTSAAASDKSSPFASDAPNVSSEFAKLLRDGGEKTGGHDLPAGKDNSSAPQAANTSGNALVAQEMNAMSDALKATSQQAITPDDASKLLNKIDELSAQLSDQGANDSDQETLNLLKQQLQQIVDSGEPKSVAEVLAAVNPEEQQAALAPDSVEGGDVKSASELKPTPLMQRVVQLFHNTLVKPSTQEASKQTDADSDGTDVTDVMPDAITQSLQAAMFRADADATAADAQAAQQKQDDQEKTDNDPTVTEIVPLSAQLIALPQWANALRATPANNNAAPVAIGSIQSAPIPNRADLDDAIPPLALSKDQTQSLPEVSLPGMTEAASAAVPKNDKTAEKNDALLAAVNSDASTNTVLNPSLVGGHSPTQTANAVQPNHTVALPNIVNHAPVTDQVHVAIKNASHDGLQQITIQLDPVDLGRVEVKMHTGSDGQTQITFTADKASTFDSLSRDARVLEHSLHEAGIKADAGSMQFNLRQQPQPQLQSDLGQGQGNQNQQQASNDVDESDGKTIGGIGALASATRSYQVNIHDGVDIHA